jgi:hypothetical protein
MLLPVATPPDAVSNPVNDSVVRFAELDMFR